MTLSVTAPDVPPPVIPVPAVTPVMSPTAASTQSVPVAVELNTCPAVPGELPES